MDTKKTNNPARARAAKDLLIAFFGYSLAMFCFWAYPRLSVIPKWGFKFGVYAGILAMLLYFLRLKLAAEEIDPDSREAFKEYLKLGSWYSFILFTLELPIMLASL